MRQLDVRLPLLVAVVATSAVGGRAMRIHSAWFETDIQSDVAHSVEEVGASLDRQTQGPEGRIFPISLQFTDTSETPWETSAVTGTWVSGIVELNMPEDYASNKLVGVIAPNVALMRDLSEETVTLFRARGIPYEPFNFELGPLLGPEAVETGIRPVSVRIRDELATTLIQSDDVNALRHSMATAGGDLIGVTVRAAGELLSVLEYGNVIFNEPTAEGILNSMFTVIRAIGAATAMSPL